VLTILGAYIFLLGIEGVYIERDPEEDRPDIFIVLGDRAFGLDLQSGWSPPPPGRYDRPTGILDRLLAAATNGYIAAGAWASMHAYHTGDVTVVGRAMGPGPVEVRKAFVRAFWVVQALIVPFLTDELGRWRHIDMHAAAHAAPGEQVAIPMHEAFTNGFPFLDEGLPTELPAPLLALAGAAAAAAAHAAAGTAFAAPTFVLGEDFATGHCTADREGCAKAAPRYLPTYLQLPTSNAQDAFPGWRTAIPSQSSAVFA